MGPVLEVGLGLLGFMSATRRAEEKNRLANSGCNRGSLCKACGIKVRIICNVGFLFLHVDLELTTQNRRVFDVVFKS